MPLFSGPPLGVGMLSAALILAIMVIPFTSSVAREVLKAVPQAQREGAYALGATRWEAIRMALFYARTGIIGAVMLGFGRALGETMAVTMVIGNNPQISRRLSMRPSTRWRRSSPTSSRRRPSDLYLHALVEIGLVLFVITLIINVISRSFIWSMGRPSAGRAPRKPPASRRRPPDAQCAGVRRLSTRSWCSVRGAVLLALVPLALVLFYVVTQGITSLNLDFFTHMPAPVGETGGGMANAIVGSLMVTRLGALFAIPIGVISGIYASEYAGTRFASATRIRRRHAQRRAVDRHRHLRLWPRRAAVRAVLGAGGRAGARRS